MLRHFADVTSAADDAALLLRRYAAITLATLDADSAPPP